MERIRKLITTNNIEFIRLETEDVQGISRGFTLDVDFFIKNAEKGIPYAICIQSASITGTMVKDTGISEEIDYENGYAYPDLETFKVLPWCEKNASVLVDLRLKYNDKKSKHVPCSTRAICKQQLERLRKYDIELYSAFEFEFYLFNKQSRKPICNIYNLFSTVDNLRYKQIVQDTMSSMKKIGIQPEIYHTEFALAQQEIAYQPSFGIAGADDAFRYKNLVKEIALNNDYIATFISKPFVDQSGSSGHFNHSLWRGGENVFHGDLSTQSVSELTENWIAGLQYHFPALTCLSCPTTNCYERFRPGSFSPVNNVWGFDNRTVAFRVKSVGPSGSYVENRIPGAAVNPYLAMAAHIIAGLDGIEKKMKLTTPPFKGDVTYVKNYPKDMKIIPSNMSSALNALENDEVFMEHLPDAFFKCYKAIKLHEIQEMSSTTECEAFEHYHSNIIDYI